MISDQRDVEPRFRSLEHVPVPFRWDVAIRAVDEIAKLDDGPLKDRYRSESDAALVTLRAEGALGEGVTCSVQTGRALVEAGLHPASGGGGMSACSGDMLLQALVACAGVTLNSVATSMEIPIKQGTVHAEGGDVKGTDEHPYGVADPCRRQVS